ncbi:unnamed protein product [Rotaria sordida]|nr:unnamed protein product [Rotaria sordida]CAF1364125.1 unnamed protein product [Rotaria sordida]CAF1379430.1 unnamed protein product [Rotaria sordida]CAF3559248.1 unnamed protein product [Rotaria sordida]CAF3736303.1 unnamed protein product [Rotaria sordida]
MSDQKPQWFWNASQNPFKDPSPTWTPYSSEDNKIIEEYFQSKSIKAELKDHFVYFNEHMQVHKQDFHKQRPIKREPNK